MYMYIHVHTSQLVNYKRYNVLNKTVYKQESEKSSSWWCGRYMCSMCLLYLENPYTLTLIDLPQVSLNVQSNKYMYIHL